MLNSDDRSDVPEDVSRMVAAAQADLEQNGAVSAQLWQIVVTVAPDQAHPAPHEYAVGVSVQDGRATLEEGEATFPTINRLLGWHALQERLGGRLTLEVDHGWPRIVYAGGHKLVKGQRTLPVGHTSVIAPGEKALSDQPASGSRALRQVRNGAFMSAFQPSYSQHMVLVALRGLRYRGAQQYVPPDKRQPKNVIFEEGVPISFIWACIPAADRKELPGALRELVDRKLVSTALRAPHLTFREGQIFRRPDGFIARVWTDHFTVWIGPRETFESPDSHEADDSPPTLPPNCDIWPEWGARDGGKLPHYSIERGGLDLLDSLVPLEHGSAATGACLPIDSAKTELSVLAIPDQFSQAAARIHQMPFEIHERPEDVESTVSVLLGIICPAVGTWLEQNKTPAHAAEFRLRVNRVAERLRQQAAQRILALKVAPDRAAACGTNDGSFSHSGCWDLAREIESLAIPALNAEVDEQLQRGRRGLARLVTRFIGYGDDFVKYSRTLASYSTNLQPVNVDADRQFVHVVGRKLQLLGERLAAALENEKRNASPVWRFLDTPKDGADALSTVWATEKPSLNRVAKELGGLSRAQKGGRPRTRDYSADAKFLAEWESFRDDSKNTYRIAAFAKSKGMKPAAAQDIIAHAQRRRSRMAVK